VEESPVAPGAPKTTDEVNAKRANEESAKAANELANQDAEKMKGDEKPAEKP
jgi:hypothetical protein